MAFVCIKCSKEGRTVDFPTLKQLDDHNKGGHKLPSWVKDKGNIPEEEKPKLKPIELNYKYSGSCPDCGREVDTLMFDIGEKDKKGLWAVAFCTDCRKKVKELPVLPIKK